MNTMCGFNTTLTASCADQALVQTIAALKALGLGVLGDTSAQHAMTRRRSVDRVYKRLISACKPPVACQIQHRE